MLDIFGWSTYKMIQVYIYADDKLKREAINRLNDYNAMRELHADYTQNKFPKTKEGFNPLCYY